MRSYPFVIDLLLIVIMVLIWGQPWTTLQLSDAEWTLLKQPAERELAATALQNQAIAAITVVSIIFVAIGAMLGRDSTIEAEAKNHLRSAAILSFVSLGIGIWILGSIPVHVNFYNVAYAPGLALFSTAHMWMTFLAAWRVLHGIWRLLV